MSLQDLSIARLGSVVNALASPRIEVSSNVPTAVWAGSLMCYLSFGAAVVLALVTAHKAPPKSKELPKQSAAKVLRRNLASGQSLSTPNITLPAITASPGNHFD